MRKRAPGGRVSQLQVTLPPEDRATLERWLRSLRCPYGLHKRARAVLLVADGMPIAEVSRRVDLERRFIYKWVARFQERGPNGLHDQPRHSPQIGRWRQRPEETGAC